MWIVAPTTLGAGQPTWATVKGIDGIYRKTCVPKFTCSFAVPIVKWRNLRGPFWMNHIPNSNKDVWNWNIELVYCFNLERGILVREIWLGTVNSPDNAIFGCYMRLIKSFLLISKCINYGKYLDIWKKYLILFSIISKRPRYRLGSLFLILNVL